MSSDAIVWLIVALLFIAFSAILFVFIFRAEKENKCLKTDLKSEKEESERRRLELNARKNEKTINDYCAVLKESNKITIPTIRYGTNVAYNLEKLFEEERELMKLIETQAPDFQKKISETKALNLISSMKEQMDSIYTGCKDYYDKNSNS